MIGPLELRQKRFGPWAITAEQIRRPCGDTTFDGYLLHATGVRAPAGTNQHADPTVELLRLERVLDWPVPR